MENTYQNIKETSKYILEKIKGKPELGLVLGSCLGNIADQIQNKVIIDYKNIPGFLQTSLESHKGQLIYGDLNGKKIICMSGRFHHYEGYTFGELAISVRVFKLLGVKTLILTNSAGGINKDYQAGDIMLIKDHINAPGLSPLIGKNDPEFGSRFFDMTNAYDKDLRKKIKELPISKKINLKEGIYFYTRGPQFETPAEIRYMRNMGADAVGMSTVPEVIAAIHCGIKIIGLSLISNMAAGITGDAITTKEVDQTAEKSQEKFKEVVRQIVGEIE